MEITVVPDYETLSKMAAKRIAKAIKAKPNFVLGLPTGRTPVGTYRELAHMNKDGKLDFSTVTTFNLDEYYPMRPDHPESYHHFMQKHLFDHINIHPDRHFVPDGNAADPDEAAEDYEAKIKKSGGIDLMILGVGRNGHIGFNEPGRPFTSRTGKVELTQNTIEVNSKLFDDPQEMPTHAVTMGIGTIMDCRSIILLASGKSKAWAIKAAVAGPVTEEVPASVLQRHPNVEVIIDEDAASLLPAEIIRKARQESVASR